MTNMRANTDPWVINEEDFSRQETPGNRLKFLIQYAILAPSAYNTQPWIFSVGNNAIQIFIDRTHWLQAVDEDQRDLHLSIGCALENLLVAADHFGYRCQVEYFPSPDDPMLAVIVRFAAGNGGLPPQDAPLFDAIVHRSTSHHMFSEAPIPQHMAHQLEACCKSKAIVLTTSTDRELLRRVDALVLQADAVGFADPAYREVIGYCVKQGVFDTDWLLTKLSQLALSHLQHISNQAKDEFQVLKGAPMLGILTSETEDRPTQIEVGQVFERIFLTAVSVGLRVEPMTHLLQVPETKAAMATLPLLQGLIPQILFRLGNAEVECAHTPRRPLEEFLLKSVPVDAGG